MNDLFVNELIKIFEEFKVALLDLDTRLRVLENELRSLEQHKG